MCFMTEMSNWLRKLLRSITIKGNVDTRRYLKGMSIKRAKFLKCFISMESFRI